MAAAEYAVSVDPDHEGHDDDRRARLRLVEGLGHDLPLGVWPTVIDEVVGNARRADAR